MNYGIKVKKEKKDHLLDESYFLFKYLPWQSTETSTSGYHGLQWLTILRDERGENPYCGRHSICLPISNIFTSSLVTKGQFYSGQPSIQLHFPVSLVAWALVQDVSLKGEDPPFFVFALLPGTWLWWLELWQISWTMRTSNNLGIPDQRTGKSLGPQWLYEATIPNLDCLLQELFHMRK